MKSKRGADVWAMAFWAATAMDCRVDVDRYETEMNYSCVSNCSLT